MVKPVADTYISPAGQPIYGGRFAPAVVSGNAGLGDVGAGGGAGNFTSSELSGSASLGDVGATGDLSYVPPIDYSRKFRFQQKRLFQRASAKSRPWTYTNSLGAVVSIPALDIHYDLVGGYPNCHKSVGANGTYVCFTSRWIWTNVGGDYLDSNQALQGPSPWASAVFAGATAAGVLSVDITAAMQFMHTNQRWVALFLKRTSGSGILNIIGVINDALETSCTIEVVYSDASTATLPVWYTGSTVTSSYINAHENVIPVGSAANGFLEFDRDEAGAEKTVASATLKLRHKGTNAAVTLGVFVVSPPVPDTTPVAGIAASVPFDGGVAADSRVLLRQIITDATSINDILDTQASGHPGAPYVTGTTPLNQRQEGMFDPSLWGFDTTGIDLSQRYPHKNYDPVTKTTKWVGAACPSGKYPSSGVNGKPTFDVVSSNYSGYGFTPLAPGLGAIHLMMPARGIQDGMIWSVSGERGTDVDLWLPRSHIGAVRRLRFRFYVLLGSGWEPGVHQQKLGFEGAASGLYPEQVGLDPFNQTQCPPRPSDMNGKFFGGAQQLCYSTWAQRYRYPTRLNAGNPDDSLITENISAGYGTGSGGNIGYQGRMMWHGGWHEPLGGPSEGGIMMGMEFYDFQSSYLQPSAGALKGWDDGWQNAFCQQGGLGHLFPDGMWRCVEIEWVLGSNAPYVLPPRGTDFRESGFTTPVDGYMRAWIDGIPAMVTPNFGFTRLPKIDWALQAAQGLPFSYNPATSGTQRLAPITNVTDDQYLGFASIAGCLYYGGRAPCPVERHVFINGIVVAVDDCYIGPMLGVQRAHGGLGP